MEPDRTFTEGGDGMSKIFAPKCDHGLEPKLQSDGRLGTHGIGRFE